MIRWEGRNVKSGITEPLPVSSPPIAIPHRRKPPQTRLKSTVSAGAIPDMGGVGGQN